MTDRLFCEPCGIDTEHRHMHDSAHGIPETHMAGSERFECCRCNHKTYAGDDGAARFPFLIDMPPVKQ